MTRLTPWGGDEGEYDRRYFDPDPGRHDVPDRVCICSHEREDHRRSDDGCSWRGCGCPWFDPEEPAPVEVDEYEDEVPEPAGFAAWWREEAGR